MRGIRGEATTYNMGARASAGIVSSDRAYLEVLITKNATAQGLLHKSRPLQGSLNGRACPAAALSFGDMKDIHKGL